MKNMFGEETVKQKIIDRDKLAKIFIKNLKNITEQELISMMYCKYDAILDFIKLCNGVKTGEKISMLFNPHRYNTKTINSKSIIDAFSDDKFLYGLARTTLFKEGKVKHLLYQVLQIGINGIQYVNEFPPYIARNFYINSNANKILDPCCGWGGRMIGAASIGSLYHGFEPCTKTYNGLIKLGEFLKSFDNGFDYKIKNIPFEDAIIKNKYDISFTSPPYYNTEIYSDEETNSCNRYVNFEEWKNKFYIPMIYKSLKSSKIVILNVRSRKYDLKTPLFDKFNVKEINDKLSGTGGLGKKREGKESFYLINKKNNK